jgi:hypothetical protein
MTIDADLSSNLHRIFGILEPALCALVQKAAEEQTAQAAKVKQLHQLVAEALTARIAHRTASQQPVAEGLDAELVRLRALASLVHAMGEDALRQVLGMVAIDGRPGDYIRPEDHGQRGKESQLESLVQRATAEAIEAVNRSSACFVPLKIHKDLAELVRRALLKEFCPRGWGVLMQRGAEDDDLWLLTVDRSRG